MVDFRKRNHFKKPSVTKLYYLDLVKKIRNDVNSESSILFFDEDLKRKQRAYSSLTMLSTRYRDVLKTIPEDQKQELSHAIDFHEKKMMNVLENVKVIPYLDYQGTHIPLINNITGKSFTLKDYLQGEDFLCEMEAFFRVHVKTFDGEALGKCFPGLDDPELISEMEKPKDHILFRKNRIEYDIMKDGKGYLIVGICKIKNISEYVHYEIPKGDIPGDLNTEFDRILKGEKHG